MWFSSGKAEWRSSRFTALTGIQCSINITHPLILPCCVCLHVLRAMWTCSVLFFLLSEQSWQTFCVQMKMKSCRFHNLKTATCQHYSAVFVFKRSLKLCCTVGSKEVFDAVWEGSVLATWLDVRMVAQSRTKVALTVHPPFCSNIQTCSGRHGGCCSQGAGAHIQTDTC